MPDSNELTRAGWIWITACESYQDAAEMMDEYRDDPSFGPYMDFEVAYNDFDSTYELFVSPPTMESVFADRS